MDSNYNYEIFPYILKADKFSQKTLIVSSNLFILKLITNNYSHYVIIGSEASQEKWDWRNLIYSVSLKNELRSSTENLLDHVKTEDQVK